MYYIIKSHNVKILILLGMLLCTMNHCYDLSQVFLSENSISSFMDSDQTDKEDRSDTLEDEVEKEKITPDQEQFVFDLKILNQKKSPEITQYFSAIYLEQKTPPPQYL